MKKICIVIITFILVITLAACDPALSKSNTVTSPPSEAEQPQISAAPQSPQPTQTSQPQEEKPPTATQTPSTQPSQTNLSQKDATQITAQKNNAVYDTLNFNDKQEFEFAQKGLITAPENLEITDKSGKVLWSQKAYSFLDEMQEAPDSVNPSQWRNAQLNHIYGLFEVTDGIYQVRGYDMTNITFIKGDEGYIVFDPLMSMECAQAAYDLVKEHVGDFPISAVVISHSHIDHYGGIKGIISEGDNVPIIVPQNFEEHAVSENLYAGIAMGRRAQYQYGTFLEPGEKGSLAIGIGMGQSKGTTTYISPTKEILNTGEKLTVDGVDMVFQMTPNTEAPAEMNTYFPQKKALWMAENCTGTLHNLYTLRGAQVRDGNAWANFLIESLELFGNETEVVFQSHNWPHWDNEVINKYIMDTAAMYKFINDQTLMYINMGLTQNEISNTIKLPEELEKAWYTRQYYGTVSHNSRAVYQKYMGFYDANPANLNPLEPTERAKKFVSYFEDTDKILNMAQADFDKGEYQWVAEICSLIVFAEPENEKARLLGADALEQLGYQAESGTWRNAYLSGAYELRNGTVTDEKYKTTSSPDTKNSLTPQMLFDYMGILIDSNKAQDLNCEINIVLEDAKEQYTIIIQNGVVLYNKGLAQNPIATLTMPKEALPLIVFGDAQSQAQAIKIEGDTQILSKLAQNFTKFESSFNIIEP